MNENDKKRILQEEIYRLEIQEFLSKPKQSKIWKFLNSSFGIFLLSSVVLAFITTLHTNYQISVAKAQTKNQKIEQLDNEISNRIYQVLYNTRFQKKDILSDTTNYHSRYNLSNGIYQVGLDLLDNTYVNERYPLDISIYDKFKYCNFRSLVYELYTFLDNKKDTSFKKILNTYELLADSSSVVKNYSDKEINKIQSLKAINYLDSITTTNLLIPRWRSDIYEIK